MSALTVEQLLAPIPAATVRASMVALLQALGLQPQNWAQGGIASSVLTAGANVFAGISTQLSNAIAQQWNPTASGGGLHLLSQYFYGVTPPQATFASGAVRLSNTGGGVYTYGIGQATFGSTVANANGLYPQYTNTAAFTLFAGSIGTPTVLSVPVQCTTVGTAGNAAPGFVSLLVSQMLGVACTNPLSILGTDGLSDAALRDLNTNSLGVRGSAFGPRSAYAYAVSVSKNIATGLPVNVNRQRISIASHTGDVTIYVASPTGPVVTTDLEGISVSIDALARPDGVTVLPGLPGYPSAPASATSVSYAPSITANVVAPKGTTPAQLATAIDLALASYFEGPTNPIGGITATDDDHPGGFTGIFASGVDGLIGVAVAAAVPGAYLLSTRGVTDLTLTAGQVAAWAPAALVVNVQFPS